MTKRKSVIRHFIQSWVSYFSSVFFNGFFTLLPITLTVALISLSFRLLKNWLEPIHNLHPELFQRLPHSEILLTIIFILLVGTVLKVMIIRSVVHWFEKMFTKIPLVRPLYIGVKQLVNAFSAQNKTSFQQIALIEFPRKGVYSLGFLTSDHPQEISPNTNVPFVNVFVPTTPNPTTGFYIIVPKDEIIIIDLTRQEAMALIISGGIIQPDRFTKKEVLPTDANA